MNFALRCLYALLGITWAAGLFAFGQNVKEIAPASLRLGANLLLHLAALTFSMAILHATQHHRLIWCVFGLWIAGVTSQFLPFPEFVAERAMVINLCVLTYCLGPGWPQPVGQGRRDELAPLASTSVKTNAPSEAPVAALNSRHPAHQSMD